MRHRLEPAAHLFLLFAALLACKGGGKNLPTDTSSEPGTTSSVDGVQRPARPRPTLPPEPPPPVADLAAEVPKLEAKLTGNKTYQGMWDEARRADLNLLLTMVSSLLASGGWSGPTLDAVDARNRKDGHLMEQAAIGLFAIHVRTNTYPADFTNALRQHLEKLRAAPHLGTWEPFRKGSAPFDITALAVWLNQEDPAYLREMLTARREAPPGMGWPGIDPKKPPLRLWLADEKAALERLSLLDQLTQAEGARLAKVRAEANIVRVQIADFLSEYKDNEVRADGKFKGKVVEVRGVVGEVKKDVLDSIYVTVGTGQFLEIPVVQCFIAKGEEERAASLSKGKAITVRGRVSGLLMNVLVKDCTIAQ
jgi:hypothetical protein